MNKKLNIKNFVVGLLAGMLIMVAGIKMLMPFDYEYNKDNGSITFTVDNEIVSDYETVERNFADDYGTTFKVYFEQK